MALPKRLNPALASLIEGQEDYHHKSRNGDSNKIIVTVAAVVKDFINNHPGTEAYATGNTPAKTWLYQMQIAHNLSMIEKLYTVYGTGTKSGVFTKFAKGETCVAF